MEKKKKRKLEEYDETRLLQTVTEKKDLIEKAEYNPQDLTEQELCELEEVRNILIEESKSIMSTYKARYGKTLKMIAVIDMIVSFLVLISLNGYIKFVDAKSIWTLLLFFGVVITLERIIRTTVKIIFKKETLKHPMFSYTLPIIPAYLLAFILIKNVIFVGVGVNLIAYLFFVVYKIIAIKYIYMMAFNKR